MEPLIFDSHAHYDDEAFDADRDDLLLSLHEKGVCAIINAATNLGSCESSLALADKYPFVWAAAGVHPHDAAKAPDCYLDTLSGFLKEKHAVAVGEIGLDYHYDFTPPETQLRVFEEQLQLANDLSMPIILHDREAHGDTLALLRKYHPKGVVHCFSGSVEMAREVVRLGMYIGLGGAVTFQNARHPLEVAADIPLDRLLTETDAPYMTPVPFRGKRCDSSHIVYSAAKIAEVRGVSAQEILRAGRENAMRLFDISL